MADTRCSYQKLDPISGAWQTVYPPVCMKCLYYDPVSKTNKNRYVTMRYFYPNCSRLNMFCNPLSGAFVSAVTICGQHLWA